MGVVRGTQAPPWSVKNCFELRLSHPWFLASSNGKLAGTMSDNTNYLPGFSMNGSTPKQLVSFSWSCMDSWVSCIRPFHEHTHLNGDRTFVGQLTLRQIIRFGGVSLLGWHASLQVNPYQPNGRFLDHLREKVWHIDVTVIPGAAG